MLAAERHEQILRLLHRHGRLLVAELVTELGVSPITVRRDLGELDAAGLLRRVHGGAVAATPDATARGPLTIGIVVPGASSYYADVIRGAEVAAERHGVRLVLGASGYDVAAEPERIAMVLAAGASGLLLSTVMGDGRAAELGDRIDAIGVPVVLMERAFTFPHVGREFDHVRTDHEHGALLALRHLASLGHRRIGVSLRGTPTAHWLRRGIERATGSLDVEPFLSPLALPEHGAENAARAQLDAFLAECEAQQARAVLVHSDEHAARLVERAIEHGMRVPEDLAVVSYDDVTAAMAVVPLTAVRPQKLTLGETACEMLLRRLRAPADLAHPVQHLSLLPELRVRASTAAAAIDSDRSTVDH